ncbi:hypothetical protein [Noviherbaspirillum suwonense]|uniref:Mor transcription activator domain-containing protein n=1 Tax=Noviherbaspirillum suwonense TaxID=1224511 RepID=A0ABY1Q738_9BURK|nr:hypothetical protein [Noviherbaspirillum suwonense]SMP59405.1 hypothetical protein SAMN06295970_10671 [Noviherbaspirillum suwonense]
MKEESSKSLTAATEPKVDTSMADIPISLRKIFHESPLLKSLLDRHGLEAREMLINTVDLQNNPLRKDELEKFLERINKEDYLIEVEQAGIEQAIKEWESKATPTAIDYKIQQDNITALQDQLKAIDEKTSQLLNIASMTLYRKQSVPKVKEKPKRVWDESALRRLLEEYNQPNATHDTLAQKYGVTRQFIARLIKKAKEEFAPYKAKAMTMPWSSSKK